MKRQKIDLEAAANAETAGALAVGRSEFRRRKNNAPSRLLPASIIRQLVRHLSDAAQTVGAENGWVRTGGVFLRLEGKRGNQRLSIQWSAPKRRGKRSLVVT